MNLKDGQRGKVTIWSRNFVCALIANFLLAFSPSSVNTLVSTYAVHLGASSVAVSYTHLDVYKRQLGYFSILLSLAERVGFEPTVRCRTTVFKTAPL